MATALSDIKRRIGTTAQIKKVTGTLQKVASAKLIQDQRRIANADAYAEQLHRLLVLASQALPAGAERHPLMQPSSPSGAIALVVFGADRGLCGSFNTLLMKALPTFLQEHAGQTVHILFRGKIPFNRAQRQQLQPIEYIENVDGLADRLMQDFSEKRFGEVHVMHWDFLSRANQQITVRKLIPLDVTAFTAPSADSHTVVDARQIEPSPGALIDSLLPEYIRRGIYNAFHKSAASENAQRQTAMSRAAENADELLTGLRKRYSRLRQETITTEMLEIVAGMNR